MRKCTKCGRLLDESNFNKVSSKGPELRCWCKDCVREYQKSYMERKKLIDMEKNISLSITNNKVDDIFDIKNLKDIPLNVRKKLHIPQILLKPQVIDSNLIIRNNLVNVLRRLQNRKVHLSQIAVAYYRMHKELLSTRKISIQLYILRKQDPNLIMVNKGWYEYKNPDQIGGDENGRKVRIF